MTELEGSSPPGHRDGAEQATEQPATTAVAAAGAERGADMVSFTAG
ncbi:hypothetical protein [Amycolatopsis sp. NPDC003861]